MRVRASKGDAGFRRAGRLVYRTQMRYPWAAAGPGRATSERPTLQTSSNQHDSNRLARTPVTNVVNLSPKTSIFTEKADGLTTFVTTRTRPPQKLNTRDPRDAHRERRGLAKQQAYAPSNISDLAPLVWRAPEGPEGLAAVPVGGGRAWPRFEPTHPATRQRHSTAGVEGARGICRDTRGRRRGLSLEKSHAIQLDEVSIKSDNAAIPTI